MTTTTEPPVEQRVHTKARPKRRTVEHLFNPKALEFAKDHNISVKALCGRWQNPEPKAPTIIIKSVSELDGEDCERCVAKWIRLGGLVNP